MRIPTLPATPESNPSRPDDSLASGKLSNVSSIGPCHYLSVCRGRYVPVSTDWPCIALNNAVSAGRIRKDCPCVVEALFRVRNVKIARKHPSIGST